jgi:hypothetical protein
MSGLIERFKIFAGGATRVYAELQEITAVIPPAAFPPNSALWRSSEIIDKNTPNPWEFESWRSWVRCQMGGGTLCSGDLQPKEEGLLGTGALLLGEANKKLASCPTTTPPADKAKSEIFECNIQALKPEDVPGDVQALYGVLSADAAVLQNIMKDLNNYFVSLQVLPTPVPNPAGILPIGDPAPDPKRATVIEKLLGRQVVYSVNVVNNVATLVASLPSSTQKKSIATVTVLYADPILEASAGAFFSTLPNRSFANQTLVTPGNPPTQGNTVITQTITRPVPVPFAAANWRLGPDFLVGKRRGAFYLTAAIGINPYNTSTEFAVGPSFSWRSLMFSAFYHEGRDLRLTQGERVGTLWCGADPTTKCAGAPPSPSTERFWSGAFAIGISVRVPSVFGSGGGSSSSSSGSSGSGSGSKGTSSSGN